MAVSEVIKLTAIPNGADPSGDTFSLSVVLSPELSGGGGTLAGTDFANWPSTLTTLSQGQNTSDGYYYPAYWDVVLSDSTGATILEGSADLDTSALNSTLWTSLFPPSTHYESANTGQSRADRSQNSPQSSSPLVDDRFRAIPIISFPASQIIDFVTGQYQQYSPTQIPSFDLISQVYAPVTAGLIGVAGQQNMANVAQALAARSAGNTVPHANDFSDASTSDAYAAFAAYQQASSGPAAAAGIGTIDFHAALAFIGQHGVLQRALGLVFDITVPYSASQLFAGGSVNSDVYASVSLRANEYGVTPPPSIAQGVLAPYSRIGFTQVCARTQCDVNGETFTAHSISGSIVNGILDGSAASDLKPVPIGITGEIYGSSELPKKLQTLQRAASAKSDYSSGDYEDYNNLYVPPPSLRSSGITIAQVGAGLKLADQLVRSYAASDAAADALDSGDGTGLYPFAAEDLVRGYVLDLYDTANGVWRSTGERNVTYTSGSASVSGPTADPFDEAAVQAPPRVVIPPDVESEQLTLSEILLSYNGWSNAVARPGQPLVDSDSTLSAGSPPFDLTVAQSVPDGRLPPLRFGHSYRLRVRVVDIANNKVDVSDAANNNHYTEAVTYGRLEPIAAPDVYPQNLPRLGESLKRLVIRDVDLSTPSLRAVYPQRVSGQFAEAHGMFDTSTGDPNPAAYTTIVPRESGQYPDPPQPPLDASTAPAAITLTQAVPFLPDPLARGALLVLERDDGTTASFNIDFSPASGNSWPDYRPFGIELVAGSALGASVDHSRRVITFSLTPGDDVTVHLSATCAAGDVALLGIPALFSGTPDPADVAGGTWWAVTPAVDLQFTYAVQFPLETPELSGLSTQRFAGYTRAPIYGQLAWSPKSTAEVDIVAAWSEPVDDPGHGVLQGPGTPNPQPRQISGSPVATLTPDRTRTAVGDNNLQPSDDGVTAASDPVSFDHEFFDTKYRVVSYSGVASSAFAECYPDGTPLSVNSTTSASVKILSTAQPEAPVITDLIPIYAWDLQDGGDTVTSKRAPSALRVFIARPWWSSGDGELLGVLVASADETNDNFTIEPSFGVSDWAVDPIYGSAALPSSHPRLAAFPNAVHSATILDELGNSTNLEVAGHAVAYDPTRDSWYCDIAIDAGSAYTPMVRLALARWQPNSLKGLELSNPVLTQITSLDPGRTVTIVRRGKSLRSVQLTGYSYSVAANVLFSGPGIAQLQLERRDGSIDDQTLGWQRVGDPIRMTAPRAGNALATWTARDIDLPGDGPHRIVVTQYEALPRGDERATSARPGDYAVQPAATHEYRLVHQDVIEL
jgi:hypothetical protein